MDLDQLLKDFYSLYGDSLNIPSLYFAPGRVNLIGEHTDYNGGFVLPCALQFGTYLLARKSGNDMVRAASTNAEGALSVIAGEPLVKQELRWVNYPLGVIDQLAKAGIPIPGLDLLFSGDIPGSAGLSSSASIEMVTAFALNDLLGAGLQMLDLVKLSQKAENEFAGVNCGIMDQFAVGMGAKNNALFLNCRSLEYKQVPAVFDPYRLVIVNTNKPRELAGSKYNERVVECQLAVTYLNQVIPLSRLGELGYPQFFKMQERIPDEVIRRRARHVVSENQRVLNSVNCLWRGDLEKFGTLMNISHDSLKENYEVTGFELDTLVDEARKIKGVLGARMTGAGFGGCTVNLVRSDSLDIFKEQVGRNYEEKTGLKADFYLAEVSDGARKVNN
jgi:galactokinase